MPGKMSYTIMYDKQFLKTSRGIIPLALYGDNNVTERINGHERRDRHWGVYANAHHLLFFRFFETVHSPV